MYSKTEYIFIKNEIHSGVHFRFCENVLRFGVALHIRKVQNGVHFPVILRMRENVLRFGVQFAYVRDSTVAYAATTYKIVGSRLATMVLYSSTAYPPIYAVWAASG